MEVRVIKEDMMEYLDVHGGECASSTLEVSVDSSVAPRVQRNFVIHAVVENYFNSIVHEKVEEFTDILAEALDQLEG